MSESTSSGGGVGLFTMLGVMFVVLKLCGVIQWSWWWVTLPFWGGAAFLLVVIVVAGLIYALFKR